MKGLFPQYDPVESTDVKVVWEKATFVFDTNVLLNLYRYQSTTRDQLLDVFEKLSDRLWIPHHVALEFQRNRMYVIAEQIKRFSEVRSVIINAQQDLKKELDSLQLVRRHSLIDPDPVIKGFETVTAKFLEKLDAIQEKQQKITAHDPLKEKIEALFEGRVGSEPADQQTIDNLYKTAEARFANEIPPGYKDANKGKNGSDGYCIGGITYKRKYGDFIVWNQLLNHAKEQNIKTLVFVTDDAKDDWWWNIKADEPNTLGARPELLEEALRIGNIASFKMYKPDGFLFHSKEFLEADVSQETLEEVRDVSNTRSQIRSLSGILIGDAIFAEQSVYQWLKLQYETVLPQKDFPDFVVVEEGENVGFEVKVVRSKSLLGSRYREVVRRAQLAINENNLVMITIIWVAKNETEAMNLGNQILQLQSEHTQRAVDNLVGVVREWSDGEAKFVPIM